jgi:hypothetical protein
MGRLRYGTAVAFHATRHSDRRAPRSLARCSYRLDASVSTASSQTLAWDEWQAPVSP